MKLFNLTLLLVLVVSFESAQATTSTPKSEFSVALENSSVHLKPGATTSVNLEFLRSKQFQKSKVTLGLSSSLPEGLTVTFEPDGGLIDKTAVHIQASETVKAGNYLVIVRATMQNRSKGATLKIVIGDAQPDAVTSSN
jgi:hypothetical protein